MRHIVFKHYWWLALLATTVIVILWWRGALGANAEVPLAMLGGVLSAVFFIQKQSLDERRLFRDLFKEFNERYDGMNNDLDSLVSRTHDGDGRKRMMDYFNLCAEEYWWFGEGYIPDAVWGSWCRGMLYYFEKKPFAALWAEEEKGNSYYGLTLEKIKAGAKLH